MVLVHKNKYYIKGIDNNLPITLDIQDKITAKECPYDRKHIVDFVKASLDSRIGEISNCASSYSNKKPKDEATKKKYEDYTCLLSVINGKEIDFVKTGVRWNVPRQIQQGVKPLPYFLKYKYKNQKKHSYVKSKLNEHCWYIEKWQRKLRFNNDFVNTSHCMINSNIIKNENKLINIQKEFNKIKKEYKDLKNQEKMAQNYDKYKDFFVGLTKDEVENTRYEWDKYYNKCKDKLLSYIGKGIESEQELANYMTEIIYNKLNGSYYELLWGICKDGILANLKVNRIKPILVPKEIEGKDKSMGREYLGRYYEFVEYKGEL